MLERTVHDNGLATYHSPHLREAGVVHAFTTRLGGVSAEPYATLNLGPLAKGPDSDANTAVAENFRRLRWALGIPRHVRTEVRQVHASEVWLPPAAPLKPADLPCADAIITDRTGQMLTIRTADCVPILLSSRDGRVVAAAHAGWRGIVAGVIEQTVRTFGQRFGVAPADLVAAIGPAISLEHFEVGQEVAAQWDQRGWGACVDREHFANPHVDLARTADLLLAETCGLARVDRAELCTYRDDAEFFSHRRDVTHRRQPDTGRMAAVIAVRQPQEAVS